MATRRRSKTPARRSRKIYPTPYFNPSNGTRTFSGPVIPPSTTLRDRLGMLQYKLNRFQARATFGKTGYPSTANLRNTWGAAFEQIFAGALQALTQPIVLLTMLITAAVIVLHGGIQPKLIPGTILGDWLASMPQENPVVIWITNNEIRVFGLLIFVPVIVDYPRKHRAIVAVACVVWLLLVPQTSTLEYTAQATMLHLYSHVSTRKAKFIIIVAAILLYVLGFLFTIPASVSAEPPSTCQAHADCRDPMPSTGEIYCCQSEKKCRVETYASCPKLANGNAGWAGNVPPSAATLKKCAKAADCASEDVEKYCCSTAATGGISGTCRQSWYPCKTWVNKPPA